MVVGWLICWVVGLARWVVRWFGSLVDLAGWFIGWVVWLGGWLNGCWLGFYMVATSTAKSECGPTIFDSAHSWRLYTAVLLRDQDAHTMT